MSDRFDIAGRLAELRRRLAALQAEMAALEAAVAAPASENSADQGPPSPASTESSAAARPAPARATSATVQSELPVYRPSNERSSLRIVGGEKTAGFPDCCAVGNESGYYCSGTLIAPTVVVTAAHCTEATRVFLRGSNIRQPADGETLRVIAQYYHPTEDLSVLVLDKPSTVTPRHVAQGGEVRGRRALLVGFGTVDIEGTIGYGDKRQVEVPIRSLGCRTKLETQKYGCRKGNEIVAGHRGLLKDSCRGDSGGPLYIRTPEGDDHYLLGSTSRGLSDADHPCGDGGIYVRVDRCLDWIRQTTKVEIEASRHPKLDPRPGYDERPPLLT